MPINSETTFEVSSKGRVPRATIDRAKERLDRVGRHCREPITHVELRIIVDDNHPGADHARAEATMEVKQGPVRARDSAPTVEEAVDNMIDRLRRRVDRHESKLHRIGTKRHNGVATDGSWHRGDVSSAPRSPAPLNDGPARIVRRKSFAAHPMTVEEAAFDLDVLDHDFYLFLEITSGATALISRADQDRLRLEMPAAHVPQIPDSLPIDCVDGPAVLDLAGAQRILESDNEPFVFHKIDEERPGQVLYRRFDGGYGVIEIATGTAVH